MIDKKKATTSFADQHRRPSLFTLLHHLYINENTFIQVILEQFFFSLFYTQKITKISKKHH